MASFTEADLPVTVHHGEMVQVADGTTIRFESNGEAKNVMVNDGFEPAETLFPGNTFTVETSQGNYLVTCDFGDSMSISKV